MIFSGIPTEIGGFIDDRQDTRPKPDVGMMDLNAELAPWAKSASEGARESNGI